MAFYEAIRVDIEKQPLPTDVVEASPFIVDIVFEEWTDVDAVEASPFIIDTVFEEWTYVDYVESTQFNVDVDFTIDKIVIAVDLDPFIIDIVPDIPVFQILIDGTSVINWTYTPDATGDPNGIVWDKSIDQNIANQIKWGKLEDITIDNQIKWGINELIGNDFTIIWSVNELFPSNVVVPWGTSVELSTEIEIPWDVYEQKHVVYEIPWDVSDLIESDFIIAWEILGEGFKNVEIPWDIPPLFAQIWDIPWGEAIPLYVDEFIPFNPWEPVEPPPEYDGHAIPWYADQGTVIMRQTVLLERYNPYIDDWEQVNITSADLNTDINSWYWEFSAQSVSRLDALKVMPDTFNDGPVLTRFTVNEYRWLFYIESVAQSYSYGNSNYTIQGVSTSKILGPPYNKTQTKILPNLNADQIIYQELTAFNTLNPGKNWVPVYNNIGGWSTNFSSWNIPSNFYGVNDVTTIDIISIFLKTIGGTIQTIGGLDSAIYDEVSDYEKILLMPIYPYQPKDWDSLEIDYDEQVVERLTLGTFDSHSITIKPNPKYNYIIISGKEQGSYRHIKRSGTSYDRVAMPIIESLILDNNICRERGKTELNLKGYDQYLHALSCPMPPISASLKPKLLLPTDVVEVEDLFYTWRGQVVSTTISVQIPDGNTPGVRQNLTIERHKT